MNKNRCAIYCRISVDRENQKSIKEQKITGLEFCKANNFEPVIYIDQGLSGGGETGKRVDYTRMLSDIEADKLDAVFVHNQDRLAREELTWFTFLEIMMEHGVTLYEDGKAVDLEDESTRMMGGFKAIMDASFRRTTSKKIKKVLDRNVAEGKTTGIQAYGYTSDENKNLVIDPQEAEVVRLIFTLASTGQGTINIAHELNRRGIPTRYAKISEYGKKDFIVKNVHTNTSEVRTKSGTTWGNSTIRGILRNRKYIGERVHGGEVYPCPAIIDKTLWDKVAIRLDKGLKRGQKSEHKYLLSGLVVCGACGKRMTGRALSGRRKDGDAYRCVNKRLRRGERCQAREIKKGALDTLIWERLFMDKHIMELAQEYLSEDRTDEKIQTLRYQVKDVKSKLDAVRKKRTRAVDLVLEGIVDKSQLRSTLEGYDLEEIEHKNRITKLEQEIDYRVDNATKAKNVYSELDEVKNKASFNLKQGLIQKYVKKIHVLYIDRAYHILIEFHLDIPNEQYVTDTRYNIFVEQRGNEIIMNTEKYKRLAEEATDDSWMITDPVISRCLRTSLQFDERVFNSYDTDNEIYM
ncbi:recombinase family protein [Sediminicola sp. 1XM1-17]|uniref:recombinase family protein n=1 Tax=Sediminicola sp. 1XM1-17 TaxID=3127702 RepID=UPI003078481B